MDDTVLWIMLTAIWPMNHGGSEHRFPELSHMFSQSKSRRVAIWFLKMLLCNLLREVQSSQDSSAVLQYFNILLNIV